MFQQLDCRFGLDLRIPAVVVVSNVARYEKEILLDPPALTVEILSPGQTVGQLYEKATVYLQHGVPVCWVDEPRQRRMSFWPAGTPVYLAQRLEAKVG